MSKTVDELREAFSYDPETGYVTRNHAMGPFAEGAVAGSVNAAGYIDIVFRGKRLRAHRVAFALMTGARAGAILSLTWSSVDFERRVISFGGTGRQKSRAVVPMHPDLAWPLVLTKAACETDMVVEWAGKPVKSIKNAFRRAVAEAGLGKEVTPHVLRHTAASWMAEAGVPMSEIAAALGHSDSRTTERVYARFSPTYLQRAVRALG